MNLDPKFATSDNLRSRGMIPIEGKLCAHVGCEQVAAAVEPRLDAGKPAVLWSGKDRRVPISAILRDYLDEQLLGLAWQDGLVFGATASSPFPLTSTNTRAVKAWDKAKLAPITLHECRHTFASLIIAAGVNAKALSTYMGHAAISITLDRYGHLMPGNEAEAAGMLDAYMARADTRARLAQLGTAE